MGTKNFSNANDLITFSRSSAGTALRKIAYGSELVTNGTFDTDVSGWTVNANGSLSLSSNRLRITNVSGRGDAYTSFATEVGKVYSISLDVPDASNPPSAFWVLSGTAPNTGDNLSVFNEPAGSHEYSFVAASTTTYLTIYVSNSSVASYTEFDNISVKEVLFDQGTLTLFNHPADIPRIEYDADGNVLGLLVEESRTNLLTYSEDFSVSGTTVEDAGEFQGMSRKLFTKPGTAAVAYTPSFTASVGDYTLTLVMERGTNRYTSFGLFSGGWLGLARLDWDSMTIATSAGTLESSSVDVLGTGPSGNPVARLTATINVPSAGTVEFYNYLLDSAPSDENLTVYFYHQQLEAGAFPTSYIPTAGATATRSADVASIPVADFGYNQSDGTVVVDINTPLSTGETNYAFALDDGTTTDMAYIYRDASDLLKASTNTSGALQGTLTLKTSALGNNKVAYALSTNDSAAVCTGESVQTDATYNLPTVTDLVIGNRGAGSRELNGHIKSIRYYPRRLTDAQLQELTT